MPLFQVNKKLLLMKVHYFIGIGGYAPISPFLTTIMKQRGYSPFIVGLMLMLQPIPGLVVRPTIGAITDRYKCRRIVFIGCSVLTLALVCALIVLPGTSSATLLDDFDVLKSLLFWLFFAIITLINTNGMLKSVLDDTICMELLGENKHDYGKQRLWGSVGWSLFAVISGGCVDWFSKGQEFKNYTVGYIISLICFTLDLYVSTKLEIVQSSDTNVVASDVKKILSKVKVQAFLLWVILFGFFMSYIWNYVFWYLEELAINYHRETLPWMKTLQGVALIIQCFVGEVPSFFLSSYILKRVDHMTVFSLMFFSFILIFSSYSFIKDPIWALPVEVLNGLSYGLPYSAAISYAAHITPVGAEGTLQGIVGTAMYGIGSPVGSFVGGNMFKTLGSITSFRILAVVAVAVCVTQVVVNYLVSRYSKQEDNKDEYIKVATNETDQDNVTAI